MAGPFALFDDIMALLALKAPAPAQLGDAGSVLAVDPTNPVGTRWRPAYQPASMVFLQGGTSVPLPEPAIARMSLITLSSNTVVSLPLAVAGKTITAVFQQDGTGGWVVSWPSNVGWPGGTAPVIATGAGRVTVVRLECYDGVNWVGWVDATNVVMPS